VLQAAGTKPRRLPADRFAAVRGKADVKWRTDDLMKLLRGDD
jgi:antitoxin PrlF